ncbi:unnamed protein product [Orchesella dallaii]|uniref:C-type lectin domain-containing protein n=1 Tax=Orchesella dallaii TaxID=48710 RepID=A0ABP1PLQ0_9HEXA
MKVFFLPLVLGAFLAVSANRTENVHVVGTIGAKTFVVNEANLTWNEAKAFCIRNGWSLATITSNAQANFLKSAFHPVNFDGWYWVGAQYDEYTERRACHHGHSTLCESSRPIERTHIIQQNREELREIGTFRGKTYFGDKIIRNWTESAEVCKSKGLQLASVSSNPAELQFLKNSTKHINWDGWFWIAKSTANIFTPARGRSRETRNCPCFSARNGRNFGRGCFHRHFTLCESVNVSELQSSRNSGYDTPEANPERSEISTESTMLNGLKLLSENLETMSAKQKQELLQILILLNTFNSRIEGVDLNLEDSTEEILSSEETW